MNILDNEKNEMFKLRLDTFIENLNSKYNLSVDEYATLCEMDFRNFYLNNMIKLIDEISNDENELIKIIDMAFSISESFVKTQKENKIIKRNRLSWYDFIFKNDDIN